MDDDQLTEIVESQRRIEKMLSQLMPIIVIMFVITVVMPAITPIMKHFGWWNLLGLPE